MTTDDVPSAPLPGGASLGVDDEVVELCRALIRLDTSNFGDGSGPGERAAAEYVAGLLDEVGLTPQIHESAPGRATVTARIEGSDPSRTDALLLHGHLDVVPAQAGDWSQDPFAAEVVDGCIWGRGAVDMKDMDAMILSVLRQRLRTDRRPARPVVLAFLADEEAGGRLGAHYMVDEHPEVFEGVTEAVSEVGGFSFTLPDTRRAYFVQTAERGIEWMRLTADGRAGHGSLPNDRNAVTALATAIARIGAYEWPVRITDTTRAFLEAMSEALGVHLDVENLEQLRAHLGSFAGIVQATSRNSSNPTVFRAGYKTNVVPGQAVAEVDARILPGHEEEFHRVMSELIGPGIRTEVLHGDTALETTFDGATVEAMKASLQAHDPGSLAVPYSMFGGTDAKAFSRLGIRGFGFAPLRLPAGLDFPAMFHGVDERVPLDGLRFGARVLDTFLDLA